MPRGGHRVNLVKAAKPAKPTQIDAMASKTSRKLGLSTPPFLSRTASETKTNQLPPVREIPQAQRHEDFERTKSPHPVDFVDMRSDSGYGGEYDELDETPRNEVPRPSERVEPLLQSADETELQETNEDCPIPLGDLQVEETESRGSSVYSRDSTSIYTRDSTSIYSSASSVHSCNASIYSFEDCDENGTPIPSQSRQRPGIRRSESIQDPAARERSSLAKKAAMFKNSRLRPQLPTFATSLPTWSMVCRAIQASQDCYDSQALTRRGIYTPANTSKDIKAMIVDDQLIDGDRIVIVSIRGTQSQSLTDWAVNKDANPVKPLGFFDDEENGCHAGFLQVTKAMVSQVASQLLSHSATATRPSLLFTGHSAGGAVAAMLYSHMLSRKVSSALTDLASAFATINCITFGAPPLSISPLPRRAHGNGVFLTIINEGDPVTRLSDAAYLKSLIKLMTASAPPSVTPAAAAPVVKVVRRSRGTGVVQRTVIPVAPKTPWEELPLWPTPPTPLQNAGDVVLLRDKEAANGARERATASLVTEEDLRDVIFGDLAMHTVEVYTRRTRELALGAMMGRE